MSEVEYFIYPAIRIGDMGWEGVVHFQNNHIYLSHHHHHHQIFYLAIRQDFFLSSMTTNN